LSITHAQQQTDTLNIFFDVGKSVIDNNNAKLLDKIISEKNIAAIHIYGYTDFLGSAAFNQQLSKERSASVCDYLVHKGINRKNIVLVKGEGVHANSAEENRQDLSDKGIQAHRMAQVIYAKPQTISIKEELSEKNLVVNNSILLENVLFHDNITRFLPESYSDLEILHEIMQKYPTLKIEIQGHVCCGYDGEETASGARLSISRAEAVYDYLVKKGIDSARMTAKGYGGTRKRYPLERNDYEKSMNRRVEILILER
jgi:outer membrane protein OmpA-like peptidoglycan-associated protein